MSVKLAQTFFKYLVAGGLSAGLWTVILVVGVELFSVSPVIASATGFVIGSFLNYTLQYFWTFKAAGAHRVMATRYAVVTLTMMGVNLLILSSLIDLAGVPYFYAHLAATGVVVFLNFIVNKTYTFAS